MTELEDDEIIQILIDKNQLYTNKRKIGESFTKAIHRLIIKLTRDNLWIYILYLLKEKPRYGYEIKSLIETRFGFKPASVSGYVILYKLKRIGLVIESDFHVEGLNSKRKYYEITELGKTEFDKAFEYLNDLLNVLDIGSD